jgi:FtsP/CotA-like multicopper oxidase with cupredoxin domain
LTHSYAEGRPPGEWFAHQRWGEFEPSFYFQSAQAGARTNSGLRDTYQRHGFAVGEFAPGGLYYRGGTNKGTQVRLHPLMPAQDPRSVWTFDGTLPPKLLMARYGDAIIFRHYNALPIDAAANGGFGKNTITTHYHNGHNAAESDGYAAAFFHPGQYYDYHWPMILAGHDSINVGATDPRAGAPDGMGGIKRVRGDWRETMSTHWFHDHMLDFTAQNVYKGNAAMANLYSALDRGREGFQCNYQNAANANLCFPSGTALDWGNRDYDVNFLVADKAWDKNGQLYFNIFNKNGFLGDRVTVNWAYKPYFNVRARRYRFRILNGSVSRYFKIAIATASGQRVPFHMIGNDGNIMEHAVAFPNAYSQALPEQGIAERYDIVIDFKAFAPGTKIYMVNVLEHEDGKGPKREVPLADIIANRYAGDPGVGAFLEFRVAGYGGIDKSMNPADYVEGKRKMIPLPLPSASELAAAHHRTFEFGRSGGTDDKPWTIKTDGGQGLGMDPHRVSADPAKGSLEIWHLSTGGGWSHPVHVHFEEGIILKRDGQPPPPWERWARKDVYRIGDFKDSSRSIDIALRVREFMGSYMEHCHNTQHEDNAMLLRWDSKNPGQTIAIPTPVSDWEGTYYEPSFDIGAPPPTATAGGAGISGGH